MTTSQELFHQDKTRLLKPSDQIMFRELDDESVLLNLHDESYYTLNESGTVIWKELSKEYPFAEAYKNFKKHYQLNEEQAKTDFNELVQQLVEKQFGVIEPYVTQNG